MISELYNRRIHEFAERPLPEPREVATAEASLENVFCGDRVTIRVSVREGAYREVTGRVDGCLLCRAAMALLVHRGTNLTPDGANLLLAEVIGFLDGRLDMEEVSLPELEMFSPLTAYRNRRKCVLLPFQALTKVAGEGGR